MKKNHNYGEAFECKMCGKRFLSQKDYNLHMNSHTGDKPYICSICDRGFTTPTNLKQHKYIHETEKRFQCKECIDKPRFFHAPHLLQRHMKIHKENNKSALNAGKSFTKK